MSARSSEATPAEIRLVARHNALKSWAHTPDRTARTANARAAADARFEKQVDPDGVLHPAERAKRAKAARAAFYADLSAKALRARRLRAGLADQPPAVPTGHRQGCQLPDDHTSECRRASSPNYGGRS